MALSGANTHDVKLLAEMLDGVVVLRPEPSDETPQNFCLDVGCTGHQGEVETKGYIAHIRSGGEEKRNWREIQIFVPAAEALRLRILFSTISINY